MESSSVNTIPKDAWGLVLEYLSLFDTIFLRATNTTFYKWCKELKPFPKYFVLDQDKCMEYLVENGFISLLDYVKNTLHFEWTDQLCSIAARSGCVSVLQHLVNNGFALNTKSILLRCTQGTCDLSMIKYLHEHGAPWNQTDPNEANQKRIIEDYLNPNYSTQTVIENMAYHGHLHCIKYAMENGCTQRVINYTPSIECLDFAIRNGFDWKGGFGSLQVNILNTFNKPTKRSICEEAAWLGNLIILKHAHQHGARLNRSALFASQQGHLDCLIYALDNTSLSVNPTRGPGADVNIPPFEAKTLPCFEYIVQKYGLAELQKMDVYWMNQVRVGNVDVLRYMLEHHLKLPDPKAFPQLLAEAMKSIEVLTFLVDEVKLPVSAIHNYYRCVPTLRFVFQRHPPFMGPCAAGMEQSYLNKAVASNNLDVLKFVWNSFPESSLNIHVALRTATRGATPEIFEFLMQKGADLTEHTFVNCSLDLPIVAYLTRLGCRWEILKVSKLDRLSAKYAKEHGCTNLL